MWVKTDSAASAWPYLRDRFPIRRLSMYHDMYGWGWGWMVPMMLLWIVVLGGVIYAAVRLALQHSQQQQKPPIEQ
jgi:hypothetical protein